MKTEWFTKFLFSPYSITGLTSFFCNPRLNNINKFHSLKPLLIIFFVFLLQIALAQTSEIKRTNHWYFGEGIGIDYSSGTPVLDTLSPMSQREACAVMSDTSGNLLFYTDGDTIWNKNHQMMANGFGVGCESSSNGVVIVPNPGNDSIYYLFTVDCWENFGTHGLRYSVINVNSNNGLGAIVQKNVQLFSPSSEQLAVTRNCNGIDYWLVAHAYSANAFYAYKITVDGVEVNPVISTIGDTLPVSKPIGNAGSMCFSPNGEKLCFVNINQGSTLFDFNLTTGNLINKIILSKDSLEYGCAFSPDNSKIYVSFSGIPYRWISQYDLSIYDSLSIINSRFITYFLNAHSEVLGLELTKQNFIKCAFYYSDSIGVFLNPNEYGVACNYHTFPVTFNGRLCKEQFPNFNTNYYNFNSYNCVDAISDIEIASINYFPNPAQNFLTVNNLDGNYDELIVYDVNGRNVLFKKIKNKNEEILELINLKDGIYLMQLFLKSHSKTKTIKFIKANN